MSNEQNQSDAKAHPVDTLVIRNEINVSQFRDGSVVLSCTNGGMDFDLVFASGAMYGDPMLEVQKKILEYIVSCVKRDV